MTVMAYHRGKVLAQYYASTEYRSTGGVLAPSTATVLHLLMFLYIFVINILGVNLFSKNFSRIFFFFFYLLIFFIFFLFQGFYPGCLPVYRDKTDS